jgi:hypothetical protein
VGTLPAGRLRGGSETSIPQQHQSR